MINIKLFLMVFFMMAICPASVALADNPASLPPVADSISDNCVDNVENKRRPPKLWSDIARQMKSSFNPHLVDVGIPCIIHGYEDIMAWAKSSETEFRTTGRFSANSFDDDTSMECHVFTLKFHKVGQSQAYLEAKVDCQHSQHSQQSARKGYHGFISNELLRENVKATPCDNPPKPLQLCPIISIEEEDFTPFLYFYNSPSLE